MGKRCWSILLCFLLVGSQVRAQDSHVQNPINTVETDVIEGVLENAESKQDNSAMPLIIQLKDGTSFSFEATPDKEKMKAALGLQFSEKMKERILAAGGSTEENDPLLSFESLSPENKIKFLETRKIFLSAAARVLGSKKITFGAGQFVGEGLKYIKAKAGNAFGKAFELATGMKLVQSNYQYQARDLAERGVESIQATLQGIDYKLWSQAPLVIESNEFGISASIGIVGQSGVLDKGFGGAEELGFSLAYNKSSRAFIFEIFHNSEVYSKSRAAISVIGVVTKVGPTISRRTGIETLKGTSFYPPAFPGYSTATSEYYSAGFSSSLGLPPPPFADMLTVTNKSERRQLIRVTISPILKGFVRLEFGDVKGSLQIVAARFVDTSRMITEKIYLRGRSYCGPVFN